MPLSEGDARFLVPHRELRQPRQNPSVVEVHKKCAQAREELRAVATEVAQGRLQWRDVNVLDELDYAVSLGVLTLPAMAVNGKLAFPSLPTPEQLRTEIVQRLREK